MSNSIAALALRMKPSRMLWLTHEQLPHPEAVICPVDENQVQLVIDLLAGSYERRMGLLHRVKAIAGKLQMIPPIERPSIPARMPNGLYEPVSWRFVLWLSHALGIQEQSRRADLIRQLEIWLEQGADRAQCSTRRGAHQSRDDEKIVIRKAGMQERVSDSNHD